LVLLTAGELGIIRRNLGGLGTFELKTVGSSWVGAVRFCEIMGDIDRLDDNPYSRGQVDKIGDIAVGQDVTGLDTAETLQHTYRRGLEG
jgi:hypothetical protein